MEKKNNILIIVLLIIIIFGLVGYIFYDKVFSQKEMTNESGNVESNNSNVDDTKLIDEGTIYLNIINQYKDAINDNSLKSDDDINTEYTNLNVGYLGDYHFRNNNSDGMFYYCYYDIDKNGVNELIISYGYTINEGEIDYNLADVYTINGSDAVKLEEVSKVYYRVNLHIYDNGVMRVHGSGSAVTGGEDFYRISSNGYTEEKIGSYSYEYKDADNVVITNENTKEVTNYSSFDEIEYIKDANVLLNNDFDWKKID